MTAWTLLLHRLPAGRAYLRVLVWRRLQSVGALALKGGAYVLPGGKSSEQTFRALADEIVAKGGEAVVARAQFLPGMGDGLLVGAFQEARDRDYSKLVAALPALRPGARPTSVRRAEIAAALGRARRRLREIQGLDHFGAPGREGAAAAIAALEHALIPAAPAPDRTLEAADLRARVWVTRRGVHVDRMACAWLIRRFIDPEARFRFVPGLSHRRRKSELRFDMAEAEFTHEGDRCSFEVLYRRAGLDDPALVAIGELVHDLDLGDGKYARPETPGLQRVLAGIVARNDDDEDRIARATDVFDDLHASFRRTERGRIGRTSRRSSSRLGRTPSLRRPT